MSYIIHVNFSPFIKFVAEEPEAMETADNTGKGAPSTPRRSRTGSMLQLHMKRAFAVFTGSQPANIDHNTLESTFLVCSVRMQCFRENSVAYVRPQSSLVFAVVQ